VEHLCDSLVVDKEHQQPPDKCFRKIGASEKPKQRLRIETTTINHQTIIEACKRSKVQTGSMAKTLRLGNPKLSTPSKIHVEIQTTNFKLLKQRNKSSEMSPDSKGMIGYSCTIDKKIKK
jgi:hypothetical protein